MGPPNLISFCLNLSNCKIFFKGYSNVVHKFTESRTPFTINISSWSYQNYLKFLNRTLQLYSKNKQTNKVPPFLKLYLLDF